VIAKKEESRDQWLDPAVREQKRAGLLEDLAKIARDQQAHYESLLMKGVPILTDNQLEDNASKARILYAELDQLDMGDAKTQGRLC